MGSIHLIGNGNVPGRRLYTNLYVHILFTTFHDRTASSLSWQETEQSQMTHDHPQVVDNTYKPGLTWCNYHIRSIFNSNTHWRLPCHSQKAIKFRFAHMWNCHSPWKQDVYHNWGMHLKYDIWKVHNIVCLRSLFTMNVYHTWTYLVYVFVCPHRWGCTLQTDFYLNLNSAVHDYRDCAEEGYVFSYGIVIKLEAGEYVLL